MIMIKPIGMGKDNRNIPCGATYPAGSNKDAVFRHFTIGELTKSETAERFGIDNTPTAAQIDSLSMLITEVLDPLREAFGKAIIVTSGFRCAALNSMVGGVYNSHHLCEDGYAAADITAKDKADNRRLFDLAQELGLPFCQLIWEKGNGEHPKWVHISYNMDDIRRQVLYMRK